MTATRAARICAAITAIMTGVAYATSAEMAGELGAFPGFDGQSRTRCCASSAITAAPPMARPPATRGSRSSPVPLDARHCPEQGARRRTRAQPGTQALALGEKHGYRNAQVSVVAPTGTIGLVMDCDTTGIEPDFALVKFKKLAGGGYFKIINRVGARRRCARSAMAPREIDEIVRYAVGHAHAQGRPASTTRRCGQGLHRGEARGARGDARRRLRHQIRLQQMDARRRIPAPSAQDPGRRSSTTRTSTCSRIWASRAPRSTPPTPMSAAP